MSIVCLSDSDDNSIEINPKELTKAEPLNITIISSDESVSAMDYDCYTSDEDLRLPSTDVKAKKLAAVKKLFSNPEQGPSSSNRPTNHSNPISNIDSLHKFKYEPKKSMQSTSKQVTPDKPCFEKMVGGVKIKLPVDPYGCQVALMAKVITAIKNSQNCLLESPTGTGKTLAILCAASAWLNHEQGEVSQKSAEKYVSDHPELRDVPRSAEYIATPTKNKDTTLETFFTKPIFGEKNIYDNPTPQTSFCDASNSGAYKRKMPTYCLSEESSTELVKIHSRPRLHGTDTKFQVSDISIEQVLPSTPEKTVPAPNSKTPEQISVPTIYYGARTHTQIQQVVKEFARTWYCGQLTMSLLSSREYSCIREFDKLTWKTKNDMCRGCVKSYQVSDKIKRVTNCRHYDNRQALNHKSLPPAFDLEDLVLTGHKLNACPFYAARKMAVYANIVFCPYNYLIDPKIRSSMSIQLKDNIVILDEAHNIEDICRDAATFSFTKDEVLACINELNVVSSHRYANSDVASHIDKLLQTMRNWDDWFSNQTILLNDKPVNHNKAELTWEVENFVTTLNNHNIGQKDYRDFKQSAELFCKKLREDPRTLQGATEATGSLIESIDMVLGYLFRCDGKYIDDFKPVLTKTYPSNSTPDSWRNGKSHKSQNKEWLSLRLMCLNPAVVFSELQAARCVLLASGTLTPLISLHSELGTEFPLKVSPPHIIPKNRVWVGTLHTDAYGRSLQCTRASTAQEHTQDALGAAVRAVCRLAPHGVLCFLPSYTLLGTLLKRWRATRLWTDISQLKHTFIENKNVQDHNDIMEDYYKKVQTEKGAVLFAVYRGKVSEGMDFKDEQARVVITIGIPYPNLTDMAVKEKCNYNNKYTIERKLLPSEKWLDVQAFRALNQAAGRCVRHREDWGAVLLLDARFKEPRYTKHLSSWLRELLRDNNHHTMNSLVNSPTGLKSFMDTMMNMEQGS